MSDEGQTQPCQEEEYNQEDGFIAHKRPFVEPSEAIELQYLQSSKHMSNFWLVYIKRRRPEIANLAICTLQALM